MGPGHNLAEAIQKGPGSFGKMMSVGGSLASSLARMMDQRRFLMKEASTDSEDDDEDDEWLEA